MVENGIEADNSQRRSRHVTMLSVSFANIKRGNFSKFGRPQLFPYRQILIPADFPIPAPAELLAKLRTLGYVHHLAALEAKARSQGQKNTWHHAQTLARPTDALRSMQRHDSIFYIDFSDAIRQHAEIEAEAEAVVKVEATAEREWQKHERVCNHATPKPFLSNTKLEALEWGDFYAAIRKDDFATMVQAQVEFECMGGSSFRPEIRETYTDKEGRTQETLHAKIGYHELTGEEKVATSTEVNTSRDALLACEKSLDSLVGSVSDARTHSWCETTEELDLDMTQEFIARSESSNPSELSSPAKTSTSEADSARAAHLDTVNQALAIVNTSTLAGTRPALKLKGLLEPRKLALESLLKHAEQ